MRVTLNWLKEYVDFDLSVEEIVDLFDLSGTEVESLTHLGDKLDNVVVGKIKEISPHPNADRLTLVKVEVDKDNLAHIVCGASNINPGDMVPVALPGAELPNGLKIKKSKLRGELSEGMLCSATELNLGSDAGGILILPSSAKVGLPISRELDLDDWQLELEVTPNRPDCLGIIGLAREVAALTGSKLKIPQTKIKEGSRSIEEQIDIDIQDTDLCPRYVARLFRDVKIGPSPIWLSRRLDSIGIRSVNNIVDVTNYVMMETGQPLHAFDYDKIKGQKIIVRRARKKEMLVSIDHIKRDLSGDMLVIADEKHPIALAGVMGGFDSEISDSTTNILIESASFLATNIMRTSRSLGLISDSSYRFEKGVDTAGCLYAADRAVELITEITGTTAEKGSIDNYPKKASTEKIALRPQKVNSVLGTEISSKKMEEILTGLDMNVKKRSDDKEISVTIPTFRCDLKREIDLIEEIARIYGLNKIPTSLPLSSDNDRGFTTEQSYRRELRLALTSMGMSEIITYSFMNEDDIDMLNLPVGHPWSKVKKLANPIAEDQSILRTSLLPSLLSNARHNINHGQINIKVFEIGTTFQDTGKATPAESLEVGGVITGLDLQDMWYGKSRRLDFFDLKGLMVTLSQKMRLKDLDFKAASHPSFHPGATAELTTENNAIGIFGQIHPDVQEAYGIDQDLFVFQLSVDRFIENIESDPEIEEIPRYPGVSLDMALVVEEKIANFEIENVIWKNGTGLLQNVRLFDLYRGPNIENGKKSLAYSLTYRSDKRTLTEREVQKIHDRIIDKATQELGATLR